MAKSRSVAQKERRRNRLARRRALKLGLPAPEWIRLERGPAKTAKSMPASLKKSTPRRSAGAEFYKTEEWHRLRYDALVKSDGRCLACGASSKLDGVTLRVDHIKSIARHPHLKADPNNLQVLCNACNWGKGNWDETDWRMGKVIPIRADGRSV